MQNEQKYLQKKKRLLKFEQSDIKHQLTIINIHIIIYTIIGVFYMKYPEVQYDITILGGLYYEPVLVIISVNKEVFPQ